MASSLKRKASTVFSSPDTSGSKNTTTPAQRTILSFGRISKARLLLDQKSIEKGVAVKPAVAATSVQEGKEGNDASPPLKIKRVAEEHLLQKDETTTGDNVKISTHGQLEVHSRPEGTSSARNEETESPSPLPRKRLRGGSTDTAGGTKPSKGNGNGNTNASKRGSSLLERIRAKERHRATLPPPPSKAETEHRSALERLVEIVPVLHFLAISQSSKLNNTQQQEGGKRISVSSSPDGIKEDESRDSKREGSNGTDNEEHIAVLGPTTRKISMLLPTLIQHLQNSLRNPISKEEAERSIRVLANDIAPDWIRVVKMGKMAVVVIMHQMGGYHHQQRQTRRGVQQQEVQTSERPQRKGLDRVRGLDGGEKYQQKRVEDGGEDTNEHEGELGEKGFDVLDRVRRRIGLVSTS